MDSEEPGEDSEDALDAPLDDDEGSETYDGAVLDIAPDGLGDAGDSGAVSDEYGVSTADYTDEG